MKADIRNFRFIFLYVAAVAIIGAVLSMSGVVAATDLKEHGIIEIFQIVALGLAVGLWLVRGPASLSLNIFGASVLSVFLAREASWGRVYGGSEAVVDALKLGHVALLLVTLAGLAFVWLRANAREAKMFRDALRSDYMVWGVLGGVLMLVGDVFDKDVFSVENHVFWEEWAELCGYFCFVIASFVRSRNLLPQKI